VEKRVYKRIEEATTEEAVRDEVVKGMAKFKKLFVRPMVDEDVKRLLEIRIRRISAYDIEKNRKDIDEIEQAIKDIEAKLRNMKRTTIAYVKGLIKKYGDRFPRRTEITRIKAVDKKAVATQNLKVSYDSESGYMGTAVRGDQFKFSVSEFDLILAISRDGSYKIIPTPDKILFSSKLLYCAPFDPDKGEEFTVVYRDKQKIGYAKQIKIEKFIRGREYNLIKDKAGKVDFLFEGSEKGTLELDFVPAKRQRVKSGKFNLADLQLISASARGSRLASKPVSKIRIKKAAVRSASTPAKRGKKKDVKVDKDGQGRLL